MGSAIKLRPRNRISRRQAMGWLLANMESFPAMEGDISPNIFHGWRFVRGLDGVIYFANCLEPGISEREFLAARQAEKLEV